MAPSRLNDSHKQEIVERYRAGDTSAQIAAAYGCSTNTVSRTVRSLLSPEEYAELKAQRSAKNSGLASSVPEIETAEVSRPENPQTSLEDSGIEVPSSKEEGEDFSSADLNDNETFNTDDENVFHEIAVLPVDLPQVTTQQVICRPFASELLPDSVYMLVDKTVELDPRPHWRLAARGLAKRHKACRCCSEGSLRPNSGNSLSGRGSSSTVLSTSMYTLSGNSSDAKGRQMTCWVVT